MELWLQACGEARYGDGWTDAHDTSRNWHCDRRRRATRRFRPRQSRRLSPRPTRIIPSLTRDACDRPPNRRRRPTGALGLSPDHSCERHGRSTIYRHQEHHPADAGPRPSRGGLRRSRLDDALLRRRHRVANFLQRRANRQQRPSGGKQGVCRTRDIARHGAIGTVAAASMLLDVSRDSANLEVQQNNVRVLDRAPRYPRSFQPAK